MFFSQLSKERRKKNPRTCLQKKLSKTKLLMLKYHKQLVKKARIKGKAHSPQLIYGFFFNAIKTIINFNVLINCIVMPFLLHSVNINALSCSQRLIRRSNMICVLNVGRVANHMPCFLGFRGKLPISQS